MSMLGYTFLIALLALGAVWLFSIDISIKALRLADPALYRAVACELAGGRGTGSRAAETPLFSMRHWMHRKWRHHDIRKHKVVRRWMYVHTGAHSALIALLGFGLALLLLR